MTNSNENATGALVVNAAHARWLNAYLAHAFDYKIVAFHFALQAYDTVRRGSLMALGEFNEDYCKGKDREPHLCYKWERENGRR